jgi:hypothetical protein
MRVLLPTLFRSFLGANNVSFGAVDGFAGDEVATERSAAYLYSELWEDHESYLSVKAYVDRQHRLSGGTSAVLAAYVNGEDNSGDLYEAEDAELSGGTQVNSNHPGFTGTGFVDNFGEVGDSVTFTVDVPESRRYGIVLRYTNGTSQVATRTIGVNGTELGQVRLQRYEGGHTWRHDAAESAWLVAGQHEITVAFTEADSGYINLDSLTLGTFDTTSVQLANAAFAASGAAHIEMGQGDRMLAAPYFPNQSKHMSTDLAAWMETYYDVITAYENILFGPDVRSLDSGTQFVTIDGQPTSGDATGDTIWTNIRTTPSHDVLHLVNLKGNDDQWRSAGKTPPATETDLNVRYYIGPDREPTTVRVASPDRDHGTSTDLPFTVGMDASGRYISFTVPELTTWNMVYLDHGFDPPAAGVYEAEDAILTDVGTNNNHAGYTGSGFVDSFAITDSGVSFTVSVPADGPYELSLRYGNGGSDATRTLAIDGVIHEQLAFNTLGSWDAWADVVLPVELTAGLHSVVI